MYRPFGCDKEVSKKPAYGICLLSPCSSHHWYHFLISLLVLRSEFLLTYFIIEWFPACTVLYLRENVVMVVRVGSGGPWSRGGGRGGGARWSAVGLDNWCWDCQRISRTLSSNFCIKLRRIVLEAILLALPKSVGSLEFPRKWAIMHSVYGIRLVCAFTVQHSN